MPETKVNSEDVFATFLDHVIAEKGGPEMSPEERMLLRQDLRAQLDERIDEAMVDALPDEKVIELEALMHKGMTDDQLQEFLETSGANFEQATLRAMEELRNDFLGITKDTMTTTNEEGEEK